MLMQVKVLGNNKTDPLSEAKDLESKKRSADSDKYLHEESAGIYLPENHANMIWQGNKRLIVLAIDCPGAVGKNFYLVGGNVCYGVVKITKKLQINLNQFKLLEDKHRITQRDMNEWWPGKKVFFAYMFDFNKLEIPRHVSSENDGKIFVQKVEFLSEKEMIDEEEMMAQAFGSPGGKSKVVKKLLRMVPPHKVYVEPFAGGAALFWKKEPVPTEVLNDVDDGIASAYSFIKSATPEQLNRLRGMNWTGNKPLFFKLLKSTPTDLFDKFYKFAYTNFHSYGKSRKTFGYIKADCKIYNRIPQLKERLKTTILRSGDYKKVISEFDSPNTFFFLDPPYPGEWPGPSGIDAWGKESVDEFCEVLKSIKGKFLVTLNDLPWIKKALTVDGFIHNTFVVPRTFRHGDTPKKELLVSNYELNAESMSEEMKPFYPFESMSAKKKFSSMKDLVNYLYGDD